MGLNHKIDILNKLNIWNNKFKSQNGIMTEISRASKKDDKWMQKNKRNMS
jgi:hypothetical protein